MSEPTSSADEQATKDELLFSLHHRDRPTLAFVECKSTAKRDELAHCLQAELPEYQFYTLDVMSLPVASLVRTLSEYLPDYVKNSAPVTYVVNVYGLENRLDEQLAAQLNLERELLFRNVPYITVVWADGYFFRRLQRLAPDLWHWVTYKFRFDDPTVPAPEHRAPLPPARLPQKGNIDERRQRIQELEERYSHLDLDDSNKLRLLREKVNTLSLLADEYTEAFAYDKAVESYQLALALDKEVQEESVREHQRQVVRSGKQQTGEVELGNFFQAQLLFNLGTAYLHAHSFIKSLGAYKESLRIQPESIHGKTFHQIGHVYEKQRQWEDALTNYNQALEWKEKLGYKSALGSTYYQIGMVYQKQRQWGEALNNYQLALSWDKQTGKTFELGVTHHQIAMVYEEQRQWENALLNYQRALEWKLKVGNIFDLGGTYHQIGHVYEETRQWEKALANYQLALNWDEQTGNTFELGSTYHQIGMVYEEQQQWENAIASYYRALKWKEQTGNLFQLGETYHQIGNVYATRQQWSEAMAKYQQALELNEKVGNSYALGGTYHQIGRVKEEQHYWEEALDSYQQALIWKLKTSNTFDLSSTYHQIGMVYEKQKQWQEALVNYKQAINWSNNTNNAFALGGTYHQIGHVYEGKQQWEEALFNYQQALTWYEQTGNTSALGGTYYHIGRVFERQYELLEAQQWFEKAVLNLNAYNHNFLHIAESALARVHKQLSQSSTDKQL